MSAANETAHSDDIGPRTSGPFGAGDRVQLTGPKGRLHTITLRAGGELHTHHGVLRHEALIGLPDGSVVENSAGHEYLALRPLLRDFVMSMPRGAAIVYPKDAAQILAQADVFPGATVVEAGVGSGALSLWLLPGDGPGGRAAAVVGPPGLSPGGPADDRRGGLSAPPTRAGGRPPPRRGSAAACRRRAAPPIAPSSRWAPSPARRPVAASHAGSALRASRSAPPRPGRPG